MKKYLLYILFALTSLCLTACEVEVHWFEHSAYVPWYYVWVPSILVTVIAVAIVHVCIIHTTFRCPKCGEKFRPGRFEFSAWMHLDSSRLMRCPKCGCKGFCPKDDD